MANTSPSSSPAVQAFESAMTRRPGYACLAWIALSLVMLFSPRLAQAQTILRDVSAAGGGAASAGADSSVDTIGQPIVGTAASANYSVNAGFWGTFDSPLTPYGLVLTVLSNQILRFPVSALSAGSDADGNSLSLVNISQTSAQGVHILVSSNIITYRPAQGFLGNDTFTYTIADTLG